MSGWSWESLLLSAPLALVCVALLWSLLHDCSRDSPGKRGRLRAEGVSSVVVLMVMLGLPGWSLDSDDTDEARARLYRPTAVAVAEVAASRTEAAWLVAQAWHETRYARYVLEDRCADGPPGARCDAGRARGPWQVHRWCSVAWDESASDAVRLRAGAECALRGYRRGFQRCGTLAGAFAAQHSWSMSPTWCTQRWAVRRAQTHRDVEARLWALTTERTP